MRNLRPIISIIRISLGFERRKEVWCLRNNRKGRLSDTTAGNSLETGKEEEEEEEGEPSSSTVLIEPISLDTGQLFSLPRLWTIPSDNNSLPNNSKLLSSSNSRQVYALSLDEERNGEPRGWIRDSHRGWALESGVCRAVTRDLSRSTEAGLLFYLERLISSKSMFATKRPSWFYLTSLVSSHERCMMNELMKEMLRFLTHVD